jgi:hypothetical protein
MWLPIYVLTKHSVAWFSPSSLPVGPRFHHFLYPTELFCPYDVMVWSCNTVDAVGHVVKKAAQTLCILGPPWKMGVLDCKQSVFPLMNYACCRSLFLWDMVLHRWCPTFRDSVVVLSSGALCVGHVWHQNGSTIFVTVFFIQLYIIITNLRNGVLRWRQFTSAVWCTMESPNS